MFGYATDETEECMPLTVVLAHDLNRKLSDLRRDGTLWWALPDTKTQVHTIDYSSIVHTYVHTSSSILRIISICFTHLGDM